MVTLTRQVVHTSSAVRLRRSSPVEKWHAVRIEFVSFGVVWLVSHADSIPFIPNTETILDARIAVNGLPAISKNAGHLSGSATSANPRYVFADVNEALSIEIGDKNASGYGSLNSKVSEYQWPVDTDINIDDPLITSYFKDHSWSATEGLIIQCADVNVGLDKDIFTPKQWRLAESIDTTQSEIKTTLSSQFISTVTDCLMRHTDAYLTEPNLPAVGYFIVDDTGEIIAYTGAIDTGDGLVTLTGCIRARRQTEPRTVDIASDVDDANKPTITEWVLIDEEKTELAYALITGFFYDGQAIPAHWSAGLGADAVELASFAASAEHFRLRFEDVGGTDCKRFIESEILAPLAVLSVNGSGRFEWLNTILPTNNTLGQYRFHAGNTANPETLKYDHIKTDIRPIINLATDYDAQRKQFLSHTPVVNLDSIDYNKTDLSESIERKGIHSGLHSTHQVRKIIEQYGESLFYEKQGLSIESFLNGIEIGTIVQCDYPHIPDDIKNGQPLNRSMMIVSWTMNRQTNTTTYVVVGTLQLASSQLESTATHNLPVEEYRRDGIDIATLPGITINNGIATGSITIDMGQKYYYVDDLEAGTGLELSQTLNVTVNGIGFFPQFYIFGPFVNRATFDFTGRGIANGGTGDDGVISDVAIAGEIGHLFPPTTANGPVRTAQNYNSFINGGVRVYQPINGDLYFSRFADQISPRGYYSRMPTYAIAIHDNKLTGLPFDLSGSGGNGGPGNSHFDNNPRPRLTDPDGTPFSTNPVLTQTDTGLNGGRGGGGFMIVSWGGSNTGEIITDGAESQVDPTNYPANVASVERVRGGGGRPGGLLWLVDGNHPSPILTESSISARTGSSAMAGDTFENGTAFETPGLYRSEHAANDPGNLWQAASRVQYIPPNESLQQLSNLSATDQLFANQRDNRIRLIVGNVFPSNADIGDLLVSRSELDGTSITPVAHVLNNAGEWELIDWSTFEYVAIYQALIKTHRDDGGNQIFNQRDRPAEGTYKDGDLWRDPVAKITWTLNTAGNDEIFSRDGVQLGDERGGDPNFVNTLSGEHFWYFSTDPNALPSFATPQGGTAFPVLSIDSVNEGFEFVRFNLDPPINVNALVYSGTAAELFWGFPVDATNITEYEVYLNGVPIAETTGGSYFFSTLTAGTTYRVGVRSINDAGDISSTTEVFITTNDASGSGGTGGGTTTPSPTNPQIAFSSNTAGTLTFTKPVLVTGITGYQITRNGNVIATLAAAAAPSHAMTDLTAGTSYNFQIVSVSTSGNSQPVSVSGTTGGGSSGSGPTLTVNNVVNGEIQGPTVSGTTTGVEAGRGVYVNHSQGPQTANVQANGSWSTTFPSSYGDSSINPYVENQAGQPAQDPTAPHTYKQ